MRFEKLEIAGLHYPIVIHSDSTTDSQLVARCIATAKSPDDQPFFVANLSTLVEKLDEWMVKLPRVKPHYAVKCNNDPVMLAVLAKLGVNFDCASRAEMDQVLGLSKGQFAASRIIYANPCKTRSHIEFASSVGVTRMTFDSVEELHKIKSHHSHPEIILRIAVSDPTAQCQLGVKYGCEPVRDGPKLLKAARELGMEVVGVSFHVGSGCNDPTAFREAIAASKRLFDIGAELGHGGMKVLDIGGGFPGYDSDAISFDKLVAVIQPALDEYFPASIGVDIIAEPGRFFGQAPFSLCANIIAATEVKASRILGSGEGEKSPNGYAMEGISETGFMYYINDGVYGSFNCILFDHFQPRGKPLFKSGSGKDCLYPTTIWGPTCDGLDQVEECTWIRHLQVGDWLYYPHMGAYTAVAASNFNGFEKPAVHYVLDEVVWGRITRIE